MINITWRQMSSYLEHELGFRNKSPENFMVYKSRFLKIVKYFEDKDFTQETIREFMSYLRERSSNSTINKYVAMVKHIAEYLNVEEPVKRLSTRKEEPPEIVWLTVEEQKKLLEAHPHRGQFAILPQSLRERKSKELNEYYDTILLCLLKLGIRFQELRDLEWKHINGDNIRIYSSKTNQVRIGYIPKDLQQRLASLPTNTKYVFWHSRGRIDNKCLNEEIKARCLIGNINKPITVKSLRATSVITDLRAGTKLEIVAKKHGHTIQVCYERYYALVLDDLIDAALNHPLNQNTINITIDIAKILTRKLVSALKSSDIKLDYSEQLNKISLSISQ